MKKIKVIQLPLARVFQATHPKRGEETHFEEKILIGEKIHTIRGDYDKWKAKIDEINNGNAILLVFQWIGKPYSKDGRRNVFVFGISTPEVMQFVREKYPEVTRIYNSGLSCQKLLISKEKTGWLGTILFDCGYTDKYINCNEIASNDGLSLQDFKDWFKGYDLSETMAIIHFSSLRY